MPNKKPDPSPPGQTPHPTTAHPKPIAPPLVLQAASSYAGITFKPAPYDPEHARARLEVLRPHLDAFTPEQILTPRLDLRAAALAALAVHAFVTQAEPIHTRFKQQHTIGEFELENLGHLKDSAFIVLYAHAQAEAAGAFATSAKVPADLLTEGMQIEARMQELCEYHFKRDPEIKQQLDFLRPGSGHEDLAGDLLGYADIYAARPKEVAADKNNYRDTDLADARRVAGEIFSHLAAARSPKARDAYDLLQRAWTWLLRVYTEVQEVGRCLLRYDPQREERFPSLYAAGRAGRPRKKKGAGQEPETGEGAPGGEGTPAGA